MFVLNFSKLKVYFFFKLYFYFLLWKISCWSCCSGFWVLFCSPNLNVSFQPNEPTVQKQVEDYFNWCLETRWICDNRFVTYTRDYALKSQVLVGLPGGLHIVVDSRSVWTDNASSMEPSLLLKKKKKAISLTEVRRSSRLIILEILCAVRSGWFSLMAKEYVTMAILQQWFIVLLQILRHTLTGKSFLI